MPTTLICRTCGDMYDMPDHLEHAPCRSCGTENCRPQAEGEALDKLHRADRLRRAGEFAEAEVCYRHVLVDYDDEHAALWGKLLCQYGVEILHDPLTRKRHPVVHIPRMRPLQETADFAQACDLAPEDVRAQYEADAAYIDEAQAEIRRLADECPPYDVFLCHKTTHLDGQGYTEDYRRANKLYYILQAQGYRVFFAPEEMEGEAAGANYEAYIFHALHTAKAMLVICSDPDHLSATWVQSEWQRYLEQVDAKRGHLLPLLYGEMPVNKLPQPFRRRKLEGIRMGEAGSVENVIKMVQRYCGKTAVVKPEPESKIEPPETAPQPETVDVQQSNIHITTLSSSGNPEGWFRTRPIAGGCEIVAYMGSEAEVEVPSSIGGLPVISIGERAFSGNDCITCLVLPDSIKHIGRSAFGHCSALKNVRLPKELMAIPFRAFTCCRSLVSIEIPSGVTRIEESVFQECESLENVHLPQSLQSIGISAFYGCVNLHEIFIPESVTRIGTYAFAGCQNLKLSERIKLRFIANKIFG